LVSGCGHAGAGAGAGVCACGAFAAVEAPWSCGAAPACWLGFADADAISGCDVAGCDAEVGGAAGLSDGWSSALDIGANVTAKATANMAVGNFDKHFVVRFMWFSSPSLPRSHFHLMSSRPLHRKRKDSVRQNTEGTRNRPTH
jgi:hypothetical protein